MTPNVTHDLGLRAAVKLISGAQDVTLVAHVQPDADALGSALALGLALHRRGATVRVTFGEPAGAPESLRGLDVADLIVPPDRVPAQPELLVALDTASRDRLGCLADRVDTARAVLVIDHHVTSERFGTHHVVDASAEATAVLVLRLLDALDVPLDEPIARCLYAGLVTDTSCFRRADPGTHLIAGRLLSAGVDPDTTTRELLDTHPFGWLAMLGAVLGRAQLEPASAQGLGLVHTTVRLVDAVGLRSEEVESVVDLVRTTSEAEVAAVLKETGPDRWSVSLRAKKRLDVSAVAAQFGGGGHRLAAGFSANGTAQDVLDALRAALHGAPRR
ncbi:MAG TPA: bifunctional oligoribonuclease/PAP phosphatase NrnA [Pseudonocardiaceae bacterium]|nr:bifunctional oligoribonuclease/PAP phosphatase NrnA [Pseudonocardiaceae bacterium]